jgi:hypothetical protein
MDNSYELPTIHAKIIFYHRFALIIMTIDITVIIKPTPAIKIPVAHNGEVAIIPSIFVEKPPPTL